MYNDGINGINVPPIEIKEFEKKCSEKRLPFILGYVNQQYCITQSGHLKYNSVNTIQKKIAIAYYFFIDIIVMLVCISDIYIIFLSL